MNEREELEKKLKEELQWVKYRQRMLDVIDEKLIKMKNIAEQAKEKSLTESELRELNIELNNLSEQVKAIDSESKIISERRIL
ncbi:hypothetical protein [Clostridium beijerinckii]|uniref:Uncharacterized protein n=1 Tax=Clostridium beijerinckii TaxID=1520 RepID=A0A9Q5GD16_CLOBE|nr:hypothetical protein [Clostridium beijerinckii]MBA2883626.1 hypothetical protein [Clostridium beijerinckii]MBA2898813.1 hypothetical protein [Clostridium beijerinckii]MBA2908213.1 hypothetical protein [Clostridium beijerinckii]MBA9013238.1 hypothetical protein [Clostridium beijerinckii]MBC2418885.1 hypothetical protein [Clostridium beijerinckii]